MKVDDLVKRLARMGKWERQAALDKIAADHGGALAAQVEEAIHREQKGKRR